MFKKLLITLLATSTILSSCKDDKETTPIDVLNNTVWQPALVDENPATNPPGGIYPDGPHVYYKWSSCNQDDSFTFLANKVNINNGGTECDTDMFISLLNGLTYSYDEKSKTINTNLSIKLDVLEFNETRLKLAMTDNSGGIASKTIFTFKRR